MQQLKFSRRTKATDPLGLQLGEASFQPVATTHQKGIEIWLQFTNLLDGFEYHLCPDPGGITKGYCNTGQSISTPCRLLSVLIRV